MGNKGSSTVWVPGKVIFSGEDAEQSVLSVVPRVLSQEGRPPPYPPAHSTSGEDDDAAGSAGRGVDQISSPAARSSGADRDRSGVTSLRRTTSRPIWYLMVGILFVVVCLVLAAGIRCGLDEECGQMHATPSLGHFLNSTDTSALAGSALFALMTAHCAMTAATHNMVIKDAGRATIVMDVAAGLLYVSVYACLIWPYWYLAIVPIVVSNVWAITVVHGLRCYYGYRPFRGRLLGYFSIVVTCIYSSASVIYIVCSAIPLPDFPGKHAAVFVSQILLLLSGVGFIVLQVIHTRGVGYSYDIVRVGTASPYEIIQ